MSSPDRLPRERTRPARIGDLTIGGGAPPVVQSMCTAEPADGDATLGQIRRLVSAGCELVRCAVPDRRSASALAAIVRGSPVPVVADIHYSVDLALASLAAGAAKIRVNPGTLRSPGALERIARAAGEQGAGLRIGINAASLPEEDETLRRSDPAGAMVSAACRALERAEEAGARALVVSLKSPRLREGEEAVRRFQRLRPEIPLHLGVTHAGPGLDGAIRSALGLGPLLREGFGDTLRVSLTGDPVAEVRAAWTILGLLGIRRRGVEVISCPTCGRCRTDLTTLALRLREALAHRTEPLLVAVMGCPVNGPGEAREADVGVACDAEGGVLFRYGQVLRRVPEAEILPSLLELVDGPDRMR